MAPSSPRLKLAIWRLAHWLDQLDPPLFRLIPISFKRQVVQTLLGRPPNTTFQSEVFRIEGILLKSGWTYSDRLRLHTGKDPILKFLRTHLRPAMTAIDVGANNGLYSLLAAKMVGTDGQVHAIEPALDTLELLQDNIKRNNCPNITVHACAVSAISGEMTLYVRGDFIGVNSLFEQHISKPSYSIQSSYPVKVERLDDLIQGPVDVVKIDVEGAELDVLAGMTRILAENPKLRMVLEWNPVLQEKTGHGPTQLPETLLAHGFTLDIISPFTTPLRSASDIQAIVPKVVAQFNHTSDIAAVRG